MNINIRVIPESEMRPEVSGADWFWDQDGNLQVRVSPMSDWRREILLALHETVEAIMCMHNGVSQQAVDAYDKAYYETHECDKDAGDEADAPYVHEHCLATAIERILCAELDVNWASYDRELGETYPNPLDKKT